MKAYICAAFTFIAIGMATTGYSQCVTSASFGAGAVTETLEGYATSAAATSAAVKAIELRTNPVNAPANPLADTPVSK